MVVAFLLAWLWGFDREISFGAFLGCSLFAVGGFFLPGFVAPLMGKLPVAGAAVAFLLAWLWGFDREISFGAFVACGIFAIGGFTLPSFVATLLGKSGKS